MLIFMSLRIPMIWPLLSPHPHFTPRSPHILHFSHKQLVEAQKHILVSHDSEPLFASTSQSFWNTIPQPIPADSQAFVLPPHSGYTLCLKWSQAPYNLLFLPLTLHTAWFP